jgi:type VI protein secretion system component VasF
VSEKEVREVLEEIRIVTDTNLDRARQTLEKEGLHNAAVELTESYRYNLCRHVDEQIGTSIAAPLASGAKPSVDSTQKSDTQKSE